MNNYNWGFGIEHEQKIYLKNPIQKYDIENYNQRKNILNSFGNIYISLSPNNINQYIKYVKIFTTYNIIREDINLNLINKKDYILYLIVSLKNIISGIDNINRVIRELCKLKDEKIKEKLKFIMNFLYNKYLFLLEFSFLNIKYFFYMKQEYVSFFNTNTFRTEELYEDSDIINIIINIKSILRRIFYFMDDRLFEILFERSYYRSIIMLFEYLNEENEKDIKNKYKIFKELSLLVKDKKMIFQEVKRYLEYKFKLINYNNYEFKLLNIKYIYDYFNFEENEYIKLISDSKYLENQLDIFYGFPLFILKIETNVKLKLDNKKLFTDVMKNINKRYINNYLISNQNEYINNELKLEELNKIDLNVELDFSSESRVLEIKTENYKNRTISEIVGELKNTEDIVMKIINMNNCIKKITKKYGHIEQAKYGNYRNEILFNINNCKFDLREGLPKTLIQNDYSGSFHTWITVPYTNKTSVKDFIINQVRFGTYLQMFEPIFAAVFTSNNPDLFINYDDRIMSSYRFSVNKYASYGTSNLRNLFGENYYDFLQYYLTIDDFINGSEILKSGVSNLYNKNGELILNYDLLENRKSLSPLYSPYRTLIPEKIYKNENKKIDNYLNIIKKKYNIDVIKHSDFLGTDIRTMNWSKNIIPPLKAGWYESNILENNKLIRVYCQYNNGIPINIVYEPPYDMDKFQEILYKNRVGFEFRIWDHLPTDGMLVIMNIIGLLMIFSVNQENEELFYGIEQQFWHEQMADAIFYGFSSKVNKLYVDNLEKIFKIKIKNRDTLYDILKEIVEKLDKKLIKNELYKKLGIIKNLDIPNINMENFKYLWEEYLSINERDSGSWLALKKEINRLKTKIMNYKEYLEIVNSYNNLTFKKYAYQLYLAYFS
jgi:hypothetical protein